MDDLDRAIATQEQAIQLIPVDHSARAMYLNNLGNALQRRFETTGSMDDLDHAIVTKEQAVQSIPIDHPGRGMHLNNLGIALQRRFERIGSMGGLDRAVSTMEQAVKSDIIAPPSDRLNAARSCSDLLISQRNYSRAKSVLQTAVQLLPRVTSGMVEGYRWPV